jgi:hypothetical protein
MGFSYGPDLFAELNFLISGLKPMQLNNFCAQYSYVRINDQIILQTTV